jgi:hypothetical protein
MTHNANKFNSIKPSTQNYETLLDNYNRHFKANNSSINDKSKSNVANADISSIILENDKSQISIFSQN